MLFKAIVFISLVTHPATLWGQSQIGSAGPPTDIVGEFVDDYGIEYDITASLWIQGMSTRYHIVEWNVEAQYALARNDAENSSESDLWTRIDWVFLEDSDFEWAFCYAVYDADSLDEARTSSPSNRNAPRTGCNGFPFSRMRRVAAPGAT